MSQGMEKFGCLPYSCQFERAFRQFAFLKQPLNLVIRERLFQAHDFHAFLKSRQERLAVRKHGSATACPAHLIPG
ncbi:MAG: hypothetical protein H0X25_05475 [Acidobacteriales bacterium]|nr:hypothetical protein [Terriglobales bacterium]